MKRFLLAAILTLFLASTSFAGTVTLAWDYEGTGHLGFRLYYGGESHSDVTAPLNPVPEHPAGEVITGVDPEPYDVVVDILDPGARIYQIELPDGLYYFRMVTIGSTRDSDFGVEEPFAQVGIRPPTGLRIEEIMLRLTPTGGN